MDESSSKYCKATLVRLLNEALPDYAYHKFRKYYEHEKHFSLIGLMQMFKKELFVFEYGYAITPTKYYKDCLVYDQDEDLEDFKVLDQEAEEIKSLFNITILEDKYDDVTKETTHDITFEVSFTETLKNIIKAIDEKLQKKQMCIKEVILEVEQATHSRKCTPETNVIIVDHMKHSLHSQKDYFEYGKERFFPITEHNQVCHKKINAFGPYLFVNELFIKVEDNRNIFNS